MFTCCLPVFDLVLCLLLFPIKSPGPNGLPTHFPKRHWAFYGEDNVSIIIRILKGVDDPEEMNKTFIVMIVKVASPVDLGQFREISLYNVLTKIAFKVRVGIHPIF